MDEATQKLLDEVAALETVTDGVVAIIENAVQEMRDNAGDEAAINAAADRLDAVKTKLANAAIEGTPATDETTSEEPIPVTDEPATTTEPAPVAGDEIDANA